MTERTLEFLACFPVGYGRSYTQQKPNHALCCARVYDGTRRASYQCKRKNGRGPHGAYCATHDPEKVNARRAANTAAYRAKWDAEARASEFTAGCKKAIRDIAAGHNDPRGLAQSLIDKLEAPA